MTRKPIIIYDENNVLTHLQQSMTLSSRDWAENRADAWYYGLVVGWDKKALVELQQKHEWTDNDVRILRKLNKQYKKINKKHKAKLMKRVAMANMYMEKILVSKSAVVTSDEIENDPITLSMMVSKGHYSKEELRMMAYRNKWSLQFYEELKALVPLGVE